MPDFLSNKIDMHVHSVYSGGPERLRGGTFPSPRDVRAAYDALGIERGVEMALNAPEHSHDPINSRMAEQIVRENPDTFGWWFCYLDPRMAGNSPDDNLSYYIDFYKERGAVGVGEMQANIWLDDPRMMNLFHHCEKCGVLVTLHVGVLGRGYGVADDPGLPRLERVLREFPRLKVLGHAQAFWSEISGDADPDNRCGYPKGPVLPGGRVVALMRSCPNLYLDLSAGSGYNAVSRDPEFGYRFLSEFSDRSLYATDISSPKSITDTAPKMVSFLDEGYEKGYLSRAEYTRICRENALALLSGEC